MGKKSKINDVRSINIDRKLNERICQGDIIQDVEFIESVIEDSGDLEIRKIKFPYVVVLTQDCDLEQENNCRAAGKNQDKFIISILVAPIYNADHVFQGEHLSKLDYSMSSINKIKSEGNFLRNNSNPRYHYLKFPEELGVVPSIIDFKHYFSVNLNYLKDCKSKKFVCKISEIYRELLSQRFSNFLSRIGLP